MMPGMPGMDISAPEERDILLGHKTKPLKLHVTAHLSMTHIACVDCADAECAVTR